MTFSRETTEDTGGAVAVIDADMGNIRSVVNRLERLGAPARIARTPEDLDGIAKIILPGVGAFDHGMDNLGKSGMIDILHRKVFEEKIPFLGICLGMQILSRGSDEGELPGLGWIPARTRRLGSNPAKGHRVPNVGWAETVLQRPSPLMEGIRPGSRFYFTHSYHAVCDDPSFIVATTEHAEPFVSVLQRGHLFGVQFHPETSHKAGIQLLRNFLNFRVQDTRFSTRETLCV